jgi:ubiquitin-protein ligase
MIPEIRRRRPSSRRRTRVRLSMKYLLILLHGVVVVPLLLLSSTVVVVVVEAKSKSSTSIPSSTTTRSTTTKNGSNPKRTGTATKNGGGNGVISSQASGSLARIRKEYLDAVSSGIAYNWVKQERILPTSKKKKKKGRSTLEEEVGIGEVDNENTSTINATSVVLSDKTSERPQQQHNDDDDYDQQQQQQQQQQRLICLGPLTTNLRHWHFSFVGVQGSVYEEGIYHGRILLPKDYPMSPPRIQLWTPNGRFKPYEDICLSASAFHPESWTPRWTVAGLVQALRLHMTTPPLEIGGMVSTAEKTIQYAKASTRWTLGWHVDDGRTRIYVDHQKLVTDGALTPIQPQTQPPQQQSPDTMNSNIIIQDTDSNTAAVEEISNNNDDDSSSSTKSTTKTIGIPHHEQKNNINNNNVSIMDPSRLDAVAVHPTKYMSMTEPRRLHDNDTVGFVQRKLDTTTTTTINKTKKEKKKPKSTTMTLSSPGKVIGQKSSKHKWSSKIQSTPPVRSREQDQQQPQLLYTETIDEGHSIVRTVMRIMTAMFSKVSLLSPPVRRRFVLAILLLLWLRNRKYNR